MLQTKYISKQDAIASYDYVEISEGIGYITFYGLVTANVSTTYFNLTRNVIASNGLKTVRYLGSNQTNNLDTGAFNTPKTVSGTLIFSGEIRETSGNHMALTVTAQKWDGTTATNISSAVDSTASTGTAYGVCMPIPLTETVFKKGEILRIVVTTTNAAGTYLDCDPTGANGSAPLKVLVPFKLEL